MLRTFLCAMALLTLVACTPAALDPAPTATSPAPTATQVTPQPTRTRAPTSTRVAPTRTATSQPVGLPQFLFFYADWCPYCQRMQPIVDALEQQYAGRIEVLRLNVDDASTQSKAIQFGVSGIPHMILLTAGGQKAAQWIGARPMEEIEQAFDQLLGQ
jgi:thiol-disulfide isomerase/thioredoxin